MNEITNQIINELKNLNESSYQIIDEYCRSLERLEKALENLKTTSDEVLKILKSK